jgi:hypothetical protein
VLFGQIVVAFKKTRNCGTKVVKAGEAKRSHGGHGQTARFFWLRFASIRIAGRRRVDARATGSGCNEAMTEAMVNSQKIMRQEMAEDDDGPGIYRGRNARRRIQQMERLQQMQWRRGRR